MDCCKSIAICQHSSNRNFDPRGIHNKSLATTEFWSGIMRWFSTFVALFAFAATTFAESPAVADFTLQDHRGKSYSLSEFKDKPIVVLAFLGVECPLAKQYAARLVKLASEYEPKGVAFLGLNPNSQDSLALIAAFVRQHDIGFPVLKDLGNRVADQLRVDRTPCVIVLDRERRVRYAGRVDDQFGIGYIKDKAQRKDLQIALDELLDDKPVSVAQTEAVGCLIGRTRSPKPDAAVTYSNQSARLFQDRCVECHRSGEIAPFALDNYKSASGWADMILEVVEASRMPPWHADPKFGKFRNERRLNDADKQLIRDWVAAGAPEGNRDELPKPKTYTEGWQLPKAPDAVIAMRSRPYDVPEEGVVKYQYFVANTDFKEDKWIAAHEVIPGNRAVVHHVLVFARKPGERELPGEGGLSGFLSSYVPGLRSEPYPTGMAKRIPAGSQIVFQVHYTPIGSPQQDVTKLGLVFMDEKDVKYEVKTTSAVQRRLNIPPGDDNWRAEATSFATPEGALLLGYSPHMHLRGKSFSYEAIFADGRRQMLLDVPHYDFNWQTFYRLSEPIPLSPRTRLKSVAHYDNSDQNLSNPDSKKTVRWGDQTWDEMMIGYFDLAIPRDPAHPDAAAKVDTASRIELIAQTFDRNGDGKITKDELPERLKPLFDSLDKTKKGYLTPEELSEALGRLR
jgi:peroxiredoxin/mono/diheme cytochrome c family protein